MGHVAGGWDTQVRDGDLCRIYFVAPYYGYRVITLQDMGANVDAGSITLQPTGPILTYTHASRTENVSYTRPTTIVANVTGDNLSASPWNVTLYKSDGVTEVGHLTGGLSLSSGIGYCNMSVTWTPQAHYTDGDYIIQLIAIDTANNTATRNITVSIYNMKEKINEILVQDQYGNPADPNNIVPGNLYLLGANITNLEDTETQTLHIIQIKNADNVVVFITTASGNLPPGYTFDLTSSWPVPSDLTSGAYTPEAFAWKILRLPLYTVASERIARPSFLYIANYKYNYNYNY